MPAPVASGWSDRRVGLAPTGKAPPCHGARGERTFSAMANLTRRQALIAAPMCDQLEWRPDRRPPSTTSPAAISATRAMTRWRGAGLLCRICRRARGDPPRLAPFRLARAVAQLRVHCCCAEATFQSSALVCVGAGTVLEENGG